MSIRNYLIGMAFAMSMVGAASAADGALLDRDYRPLAGKEPVNLNREYGGKVLLVVNTASKCGYTPQYEGLEALHQELAGRGFSVLGFPSNDFKGQEPGSETEIQEFCTLTYGVKFPMFQKVHVIGPEATPLYQDLTRLTGVAPGWNFHKYLIGSNGELIGGYPAGTDPLSPQLVQAIGRELQAG